MNEIPKLNMWPGASPVQPEVPNKPYKVAPKVSKNNMWPGASPDEDKNGFVQMGGGKAKSEDTFKLKYYKYKAKYLKLKKQLN